MTVLEPQKIILNKLTQLLQLADKKAYSVKMEGHYYAITAADNKKICWLVQPIELWTVEWPSGVKKEKVERKAPDSLLQALIDDGLLE